MARFDRTRYVMEDDALWFPGVAAGKGSGRNNIFGTSGDDQLRGTDGGDNFNVPFGGDDGGDDILRGGAGNDKFKFGNSYTDRDTVYGGEGRDQLNIHYTVDDNLTLGPDNLRSVESIYLQGSEYSFTILDGTGDLRFLEAGGAIRLDVDGSAVTKGRLTVYGTAGVDHLIGGGDSDTLVGSSGPDILTGGAGLDRFKYYSVVDSTVNGGNKPDTITDFSGRDRIVLEIDGSDAVSYHIGSTEKHVGDVLTSYSAESDRTLVEVFTDDDDRSDLQIYLIGDCSDLHVINGAELTLG